MRFYENELLCTSHHSMETPTNQHCTLSECLGISLLSSEKLMETRLVKHLALCLQPPSKRTQSARANNILLVVQLVGTSQKTAVPDLNSVLATNLGGLSVSFVTSQRGFLSKRCLFQRARQAKKLKERTCSVCL